MGANIGILIQNNGQDRFCGRLTVLGGVIVRFILNDSFVGLKFLFFVFVTGKEVSELK